MKNLIKMEKMDLLVAVYIFCVTVSEIMSSKTFHILNIGTYPLNASVAIFVIPLIYTINDMVTEVYGVERARSIFRSSLLVIILILIYSLLATALPPSSRYASSNDAYVQIFGLSARISAASLIAFIVSDLMDIMIFSWIRQRMGKKALWFRNNASNFISEFFDSTVFIFLAFYALDMSIGSNLAFLFSLIIPYWLLRCGLSIIETPLVYLGVNWLKSSKK